MAFLFIPLGHIPGRSEREENIVVGYGESSPRSVPQESSTENDFFLYS
jgi:hypothetical protein